MKMTSRIATRLVSGLPQDAYAALFEFGNRLRFELQSVDNGELYEIIHRAMLAFIKLSNARIELQVEIPNGIPNKSGEIEWVINWINSLRVQHTASLEASEVLEIMSIENQIHNRDTFGIAVLSDSDKSSAREHLEKARDHVLESALNDRKKNAIVERIIDALRELDTVGTRTDRFFVLMGDAAFALGEMAEKAKPFTQEIKDVLKIVFRRREDTEGVRLPRGEDQILLPGEEK
jgi:hypothetical protein